MKKSWILAWVLGVTQVGIAPAQIAVVRGEIESIPELHQVTEGVYRGGRPERRGLQQLKRMGVRTIINLEDDRRATTSERADAASLGMDWYGSPMNAGRTPKDHQIDEILGMLQDPSLQPVFIHCKHGQDRTGLVMGLYRVEVQHWDAAKAYQEMLDDGFHPQYQALDQYFRDRTGFR